jgi:hypothetical protein
VGPAVINKVSILFLTILLVGCMTNPDKPGESGLCSVYKVEIDKAHNEKIIYIHRSYPKGVTEGSYNFTGMSYNFIAPLGRLRNIINPRINGPDLGSDSIYGYVIFDEDKHEMTIKIRQLELPDNQISDPTHGGGTRSVPVLGDEDVLINGTYHIDNPDAFK